MGRIIVTGGLAIFAVVYAGILVALLSGRLQHHDNLIYLVDLPANDQQALWMHDLSNGIRYRLLRANQLEAFDLSPDGRTIAYQQAIGRESSLHLLSLDSPTHERIAAGDVECPRWSPDGLTLAYQDYHQLTLHTLDIKTGRSQKIVRVGGGMAPCSFDWSGDGTALIYSEWYHPAPARVVRRILATGEIEPLFGINRPVNNLVVSPDGSTLAYNGRPYVNIISVQNSDSRTNLSYFNYTFAVTWSPEQNVMAFTYQKPIGDISNRIIRGIALVDSDGSLRFQQDVGHVSHLAWWSGL